MVLHLIKFESPSPKDALCQVWLKLAQWFWIRRSYFRYFIIISPWKRVGPFIWTNLSPHHPKLLCAKFGWNWLSGSFKFCQFVIIRPWKKSGSLLLNKLESSSPKNALWQVWLKLAQRFLIRRFLKFVNVFSLFCNYLPLEKGWALHLNKLESPAPMDALCQISWNWSMVMEKKMKIWKVYDNKDAQWTNFDQESWLEPSTQVS